MIEVVSKRTLAAQDSFNPGIHGARGLFALGVFIFHIANSKLPFANVTFADWVQAALMSLAFGVELFFVISGIVILGAYRRSYSMRKFLWDRVTRIFPVLWATVFLVFALSIIAGSDFGQQSWIGYSAVLLGNFMALPPILPIALIHPAAWSLSYEFAFYLLLVIFGCMAAFVSRRLAVVIVCLMAVAVFWNHVRATYFLAGLAIGAGLLDQPVLRPILRFPLLWMLVFLAAWQAVAMMVGGNIHSAVWRRIAAEPELWMPSAIAFAAATFAMAGIAQGFGQLSVFLRTRPMQWLGTISFSFYLWQTPVLAIVKKAMEFSGVTALSGSMAQPVFFVLALPPTLLVSALSQRWLEQGATRALRSGNWFRKTKVAVPG